MAHTTKGKRRGTRRVLVFVVPPIEELDVVGSWAVFTTANSVAARPVYELQLVTAGKQRTIVGDTRLRLLADRHYKEVKGRIDTLLVPGGTGPQQVRNKTILGWIRNAAARSRRVASVCTGSYLLAAAGILNGKKATTHWMYAKDFAHRYPRVTVEPNRIYIRQGNVYTSAGVTAGMDLALALVEEDLGSAVALKVAQVLVLFLRRPGGQSQFSAVLSSQASAHKPLRELQIWMAEHVQQDLSVERLASRVAMSPRNFARVFAREIGVTPAQFVEHLRVETARRELETSVKGLEEIGAAVGFKSAEVMRRAFLRQIGTSPASYRERFSHRVSE